MPEIQMPKLSDTMTEGTLVAWKKKKGDQVSAGEVLAEIETDKATMEWESPEDGTLSEIYVEEDGKVNVGDRIAFIGSDGDAGPKEEQPAKEAEPKPVPPQTQEIRTASEANEKPTKSDRETEHLVQSSEEGRVKASPIARRIAAEQGVDISTVRGSGPG